MDNYPQILRLKEVTKTEHDLNVDLQHGSQIPRATQML